MLFDNILVISRQAESYRHLILAHRELFLCKVFYQALLLLKKIDINLNCDWQ